MQTNNIKKHPTKNEYIYGGSGLWVRNFTNDPIKPYDINDSLISQRDLKILIENELENNRTIFQKIDSEEICHEKIVIISNGYNFFEKQRLLEALPKDVIVIGVNGALQEWNVNRRMNYYLVNNPYKECMDYLPNNPKTSPRVIASTRTYPPFIKAWKGIIYTYSPVDSRIYNGIKVESDYQIDDYRNSVCAAIGLAYRFKVKKLLLLGCDEASKREKPGMVKEKDYWIYPQHKVAHNLIDANLYWLKSKKINIVYHSVGLEYINANYIAEDKLIEFFDEVVYGR